MALNSCGRSKNDERIFRIVNGIIDILLKSVPENKKDEMRTIMLFKAIDHWGCDTSFLYVILRNVKYSVLRKKELDEKAVICEYKHIMEINSEEHKETINELLYRISKIIKAIPERHQQIIRSILRLMLKCRTEADRVKAYKTVFAKYGISKQRGYLILRQFKEKLREDNNENLYMYEVSSIEDLLK